MDIIKNHIEGNSLKLMYDITDEDGLSITTAATVTCYVFEQVYSNNVEIWTQVDANRENESLVVGDVIHNPKKTTKDWTRTSSGYNFSYVIPGSYFANGDTVYQIEITIVSASGATIRKIARVYTTDIKQD